jgi:hypothetical protein
MWNLVGPAGTLGIIVVILIISGIEELCDYLSGAARPVGPRF